MPEITLALGPFWTGALASLVAGLGTALGAAGLLFFRRLSARVETTLLAAAAGIMLAASVFSLLLPAMEEAAARGSPLSGGGVGALGLLLGAGLFYLAHRAMPHQHFVKGREGMDSVTIRRLWLFVLAITLHNFPEGLAVGVGAGQEDAGKGLALTLGILVQNMPEGLIAAVALYALGYGMAAAMGLSALTGMVEPVGGIIGAGAVGISAALLPWALAVAAGAMITVVGGEMIPETHRKGHENRATVALLVGFAGMLLLDSGLG